MRYGSGAKRLRQLNYYEYYLLYGQFSLGIKKLTPNFYSTTNQNARYQPDILIHILTKFEVCTRTHQIFPPISFYVASDTAPTYGYHAEKNEKGKINSFIPLYTVLGYPLSMT